MKIYDFPTRDTAVLVRDKLTTRFTGHSFSVRTNGSEIDVDWQDGPSRQDVVLALDKYRNLSWGRFIKVFPDGSFLSLSPSLIRDLENSDVAPVGDFIYARVYISRIEIHRDMTAEFVEKMVVDFEKESGIAVALSTLSRNKNYYIAYPASFTVGGKVFDRWGDDSREYNHTRPTWIDYCQKYSDYDESRSAENFLIPAASLAEG